MLTRRGRFVAVVTVVVATGATVWIMLSGVSADHEPAPSAATTRASRPGESAEPRARLAARAAVAKDRRFTAGYTLTRSGRRAEAVAITVATDGLWRVDLPGGSAWGGDLALIGRPDGQYQCSISSGAGRDCVRVAGPGVTISPTVDPAVQHPFTDWLDILTDPTVAITVTVTRPLPDAAGTCFAVEATTVSLAPPIESSVFCYTEDGTLTAVRASFGMLTISQEPAAAPATIELPAPVTSRAPLPIAGGASPSGKRTPSGATSRR